MKQFALNSGTFVSLPTSETKYSSYLWSAGGENKSCGSLNSGLDTFLKLPGTN